MLKGKIFVALLAGASSFVAPAYVQAQDSGADEAPITNNDIVVTGIRASLQTNAQIKKNATEIVDSITATDIGKLPDSNVAETLTRVPGVQAYRFGGEAASPTGVGSGITVRGLTGQTASRTNGRAYFTAGQREFNIEGTSPAMVAGIDVYKNPSADHIEGGIGGVVDVRTRRPLEFKGFTASASIGAKYNDLAEKAKPEFFGLISNKWDVGDGGEFGVMLAGSYLQTINRGDNTPAAGGVSFRRAVNGASAEYAAGAASGLYNSAYVGRADVDYLATVTDPQAYTGDRSKLISVMGENPTTGYELYVRTRKGVNGMVQYKPNSDLEFYAEGLYNWYRYHQEFGFLGTNNSRYVQNLTTRPYDITEGFANRNLNGGADDVLANQILTGGTFLGSGASVTSGLVNNTYWTAVAAGGFKWHAADRLQADFDFSYVKSRVKNDGRALTFLAAQGQSWDITRNLSGQPTRYSFGGADLSQASSWVYGAYNAGPSIFDDNGIATRLDLTRSFDNSFIENIKFGVRFATQNDTFRNYAYSGKNLTTNGLPLVADYSNAISVGDRGVLGFAPSNFMDGSAGYTGGFLLYQSPLLAGNRISQLFPQASIPDEGDEAELLTNRRRFEEKTYAAYLLANFANKEHTLRGNVGVRVVKTDTFTRAMISTPTGIQPNDANSSYTDVLPTFNATWYATPKTLVRFGYGKGITRPDPGSLNPSLVINQGNGTASIGNPDLKPQKGESYDLSVEHYFSGANYVSAGIFYKRVDGFFSTLSGCETIAGYTYTGPILNGCSAGQYGVTRTVNAQTGTVKGLETSVQSFLDYDFVPDFLHRFGGSASFTYVGTKIPVLLSSGLTLDSRQPFTSKYNYTLSGFYEDDNISARLVYTWRSRSILFGAGNAPADGRYIQAFGLLDASVNFNLPKGLQLSLTASNLTNTAPNRYYGEPGYYTGIERQHFMNGRTFGAALRWRFGG